MMMPSIIQASLAAAWLFMACSLSADAAGLPALFNTIEVRADQQLALPQWRRVLSKLNIERTFYSACTASRKACSSKLAFGWQVMLDSLQGQDRLTQIKALNRFANRIPYHSDLDVWGKSDYWASPVEFMQRNGDCEDYAILKYESLRQLGVPAGEMRMVVVEDTLRNLAHAVLVVLVDGRLIVLDNLTNALLPQERTPQYVPYYSVNEDARWAHLSQVTRRVAALEIRK
jgi:predicted transglutaminase-like cysteine proteinase